MRVIHCRHPLVRALSSPPIDLFTSGQNFAQHFSQVFHPLVGEYDLIGKYPDARDTIRNVDGYHTVFEELRMNISPELELIASEQLVEIVPSVAMERTAFISVLV